MHDFDPREHMTKELIKEAFKEWLDEKAAQFGKWTIKWFATILCGAVIYFAANHGLIK